MKICIVWWVLFYGTIAAQGAEPVLPLPKHPKCMELARVANRLISLGEKDTVLELTELADKYRKPHGVDSQVSEQIGWICRLLYTPAEGRALRRPGFGGLMLPDNTMSREDWPLYPLAESKGVFFVLRQGYMLAGVAEDPVRYLEYCRKDGKFRKEPLPVPSAQEARLALDALLSSEVWLKIRWVDSGSWFSYTMDSADIVRFLTEQTQGEVIP
jgi:hypothetical protein